MKKNKLNKGSGCRLHVAFKNPELVNAMTDDGRFHVYDVGPEEFESLYIKYPKLDILEWGKYQHEGNPVGHPYEREIRSIKEIVKRYAPI